MKKCSKCGQVKPLDDFHLNKAMRDGHQGQCKECRCEFYRQPAGEETKRRRREKYAADKKLQEQARESHLRRKFRLSEEKYGQLHERQGGLCAICGRPETEKYRGEVKNLAVDHNHSTGQIRSLLCRKCNHGIGNFMEDEAILVKAIQYLRRHKLKLAV